MDLTFNPDKTLIFYVVLNIFFGINDQILQWHFLIIFPSRISDVTVERIRNWNDAEDRPLVKATGIESGDALRSWLSDSLTFTTSRRHW